TRMALAYSLPAGGGATIQVELADSQISGGKLGGFLQFRSASLDAVQDQLGQLAVGLALAFNAQHEAGLDLNGDAGGPMFGLGAPTGIPKAGNGGDGTLTAAFTDAGALRATAYDVVLDGANYQASRRSDGATQTLTPAGTPPSIEIDGLSLELGGTAMAGDSWTLQPMRDAARDLSMLITDPAKIALADATGGTTNGANGLELAKLQTRKVLAGGTLSLAGQFSQLINNVGVQTQQIKTANTAQGNL